MEQQLEKIERVKVLNEMPKELQALRKKVLENFESKMDGLDIERVKNFMKERGLPVTDFIVFEDEDIPKLQALIFNFLRDMAGSGGEYLPGLNLIFIRRETTDFFYEESKIVHELSHGANKCAQYVENISTGKTKKTRAGFALPYIYENKDGRLLEGRFADLSTDERKYGWFLEEGFADMQRGEYIKNFIPTEYKEKVYKALNLAKDTSLDVNVKIEGISYKMFLKYLYLKKNDRFAVLPSSIAATGLEMLCEKIPNLRQTLIEARSDINKLREIPKLINAIKPGLYAEIQKCGYSEDEFIRVQNIIKEAIENSK